MKELEAKNKDIVKEERQVPHEQKQTFKYSKHIKAGQTVWELDLKTGYVTQANIEESAVSFENTFLRVKKIIERERCLYVVAINKKNAVRKFKKFLEQQKC